ncbi:MAG: RNA-binding protein [Deltaproteobacteria bacterium]|nr:RNA-binding protein [Deltaproteobacteria bacterium]
MNIYVGKLAHNVTEDELRTAFAAFGKVNAVNIIKDKYTSRPKGFGFVEMPSAEEAEAAISQLHGKDMQGQALDVNEAKPRVEGSRGGGGRRGGSGGRRF